MRSKTNLFMINGMPILVPDVDVGVSYEDLDSSDSGRDESGAMHRIVVRYKVPVWSFAYNQLTEEEKQYMESIFPDAPTFIFTHPDRLDASKSLETECYRSKYGISWRNAVTGLWSGYAFNIISC